MFGGNISKACFAAHGFIGGAFERFAPELRDKPYVLIDALGRVEHASAPAQTAGITIGMSAHTVRSRLPICDIRTMDERYIAEVNGEFFDILAATGLPCERISPGSGYLDLSAVAPHLRDVREVTADLGRTLRQKLGEALTPAIGWGDQAKFVARAAASVAPRGTMRLITAGDAPAFLAPLPITHLPLPIPTLQQLKHLGITTCSAFASLSQAAVRQRWGREGVESQKLARGEDRRHIRPELRTLPSPIEVSFDAPVDAFDHIVQPLSVQLEQALAISAQPLEGITQLKLVAHTWDRADHAALRRFGDPLTDGASLRRVLEAELRAFHLTSPLIGMSATIVSIGECELRQLSLFDLDQGGHTPGGAESLSESLRIRHAAALCRVETLAPTHPILERRYRTVRWGAQPK